jgi:hypothetical protein
MDLECQQHVELKADNISIHGTLVLLTLMGQGFLIIRQVHNNYQFVGDAIHRSDFRSQRPQPYNLSTTSSLVINHVTI